jgi:hypothetical protein
MRTVLIALLLSIAFLAFANDTTVAKGQAVNAPTPPMCKAKTIGWLSDDKLLRVTNVDWKDWTDDRLVSSYEPTGCCCIKVGSDPPSCSCCESKRLCADDADKVGGTYTWTEATKCP